MFTNKPLLTKEQKKEILKILSVFHLEKLSQYSGNILNTVISKQKESTCRLRVLSKA